MSQTTSPGYWTLAVALLGAVTGVAALLTQVWGLVLAGPRVKVTLSNGFGTQDGKWYLSLDASNVGRLPVTLLDMGVAFRHGDKWKHVPLPGLQPHTWLPRSRVGRRRAAPGRQHFGG